MWATIRTEPNHPLYGTESHVNQTTSGTGGQSVKFPEVHILTPDQAPMPTHGLPRPGILRLGTRASCPQRSSLILNIASFLARGSAPWERGHLARTRVAHIRNSRAPACGGSFNNETQPLTALVPGRYGFRAGSLTSMTYGLVSGQMPAFSGAFLAPDQARPGANVKVSD